MTDYDHTPSCPLCQCPMRKDIDEVQLFPCEHKLCLHCMIDLQADTLKFQSKAICCKDCGAQVERFTHHREKGTRKRNRDDEVQNEELIRAAKDRNISSARKLLSSGAKVNVKDHNYGRTPLHWACWNDHEEMVKELVSAGADIEAKENRGRTPLHLAYDYLEIVKELVSAGADTDAKDEDGDTPLHLASSEGYLESVRTLVIAGADIRAVNNDGLLPMDETLPGKESDVLNYLMKEFYASIFDHEGRLPLHAILEDASVDGTPLRRGLEEDVLNTDDVLKIIAFLVDQDRESLNARNQDGELPLHVACVTSANPEIIEFLVDYAPGSLFLPRTTDGAYPLHVALERGASSDTEVIKMLLKRHDPATIMLRNNAGETALHVACRCGVPFEIVQSLVHHYKASVQAVTPQGDLPLFLVCATVEPSLDVIFLLLKLYPDLVYP
jgi:ankyrin repeat protein